MQSVFTVPDQFEITTRMSPKGDQPKAIDSLVRGIESGMKHQTLVGVTGSGKTFTMANVIQRTQRPTLIISHNKVLAAQLYSELKSFFPDNAVGYFVSYYDYYQPEAYIPRSDTYIEKQTQINEEIDRLRLAATSGLLERRDAVIVASVSCIYGLGNPEDYKNMVCVLSRGDSMDRQKILRRLVELQYERRDADLVRGTFRVKGDVVDVFPAYGETPVRIELFGDEIDRIAAIDVLKGNVIEEGTQVIIYPAKHFVTPEDKRNRALKSIEEELQEQLKKFNDEGKLLEAQRLEQRTRFDLEMIRELGYCQGIENYSRHLSGRAPGQAPWTLLDYFPDDFLIMVDESHMTLPQVRGMFAGDRTRKETLVRYGFRLPSALDNRPLRFDEFQEHIGQVVYVSATPDDYELQLSDQVVEQIIRPTGLVDPIIHVRPATGQVDDLVARIRERVDRKERILVTTLTTRMAEDLSDYLLQLNIKVHYLHHQIDTLERVEIVKNLRTGDIDVIVGVNLLREGLDLPEVSLVAVLDADKEGFLRSETSLIQICGRAARNVGGEVILYADKETAAMKAAMDESGRRREIQLAYNKEHGITPATIQKEITNLLGARSKKKHDAEELIYNVFEKKDMEDLPKKEVVKELRKRMLEAAENLEFEKAMVYRDKIGELEKQP